MGEANNGTNSSGLDVEFVILIHGTGAGKPNPIKPQWWEVPDSEFAKHLKRLLGEQYALAEPFCWSGSNSEYQRHLAGKRLLDRIRTEFEERNLKYHLVGHSHGGSVIWNALVSSIAFRRSSLKGLKTWTTVGTPFLTFKPDYSIWWLFFSASVALLATAEAVATLREVLPDIGSILAASSLASLIGTIILFVALSVVCGLFLLELAVVTTHWCMAWRNVLRSGTAAQEYGSRWQGHWHPEDEPIAGLAGTLIRPPKLVSQNRWEFYNAFVANPLNQLAWSIVTSRLQGADISGLRMIRASSFPAVLSPGHPALSGPIAQELQRSANQFSGATVSDFRRDLGFLSKLKTADEAITKLVQSITWRELIHTSYFANSDFVRTIAACIRNPNRLVIGEKAVISIAKPPRAFQALAAAKATIAFLLISALALAAFFAFSASIAPYAAPHQLDEIYNAVAGEGTIKPELLNLAHDQTLGELLGRLRALNRLKGAGPTLQQIKNTNSRVHAAQKIAYSLGHSGNFRELSSLIQEVQKGGVPTSVAVVVGLQGLIGALASDAYKDEVELDSLLRFLKLYLYNDKQYEPLVTRWLLPLLFIRGLEQKVQEPITWKLESFGKTCENAKIVAINAAKVAAAEAGLKWLGSCSDTLQTLAILDEAASISYDAGDLRSAKVFLKQRLKVSAIASQDVSIRLIRILLDAGLAKEAVSASEMLSGRWKRTKPSSGVADLVPLLLDLRNAGRPELASDLASPLLEGLKTRLAVGNNDPIDRIDAAREVATLLSALGRQSEALDLVDSFVLLGTNIFDSRRSYETIMRSVVLAHIGQKDRAARNLSGLRSTAQTLSKLGFSSDGASKTRIELRLRTIDTLTLVDEASARAEIETCVEEIAHLEEPELREKYFGAIVQRFIAIKDAYRARAIAERSGGIGQVLAGYKIILDSMLASSNPRNLTLYGLDDGLSPDTIDIPDAEP
jgi:hypothetical protein